MLRQAPIYFMALITTLLSSEVFAQHSVALECNNADREIVIKEDDVSYTAFALIGKSTVKNFGMSKNEVTHDLSYHFVATVVEVTSTISTHEHKVELIYNVRNPKESTLRHSSRTWELVKRWKRQADENISCSIRSI